MLSWLDLIIGRVRSGSGWVKKKPVGFFLQPVLTRSDHRARISDMHRIGSAKGGPIFTTVGFGNGDNLLKKIQRGKRLYTWPRLDATKRRGERHRNREDFDSISERPQNHNRS